MKHIFTLLIFCVFLLPTFAQKSFTVNNENLQLTPIVEGNVDLFYTITDKNYRYFLRTKDGVFFELKNEKLADGFNQEYVSVLKKVAPNSDISLEKVKLTTGSLKRFIDAHNKNTDIDYSIRNTNLKVNFRLAFFLGSTNHPLVQNLSDNSSFPQVAAELELFGDTDDPLHSGMIQIRNTFGSSTDYRSTEISLGYRFRFVRKKRFNLYAQTRFATINSFSVGRFGTDQTDNTFDENINQTNFDVPFIFGIGADIKVSKNSYISILYDRFFAFGLDNNDSFPADFMVGYKFKL